MWTVSACPDAAAFAESNVFYRRPDWYDQVQFDPAFTTARQVEQFAAARAPHARSLLDLGCGTGRDLEALTERFSCVGVDLQPDLVRYARQTRPLLDIRVGDIRDVRLEREFDVVTCLGNTLAYLHDEDDLAATFTTCATHARPGAMLVIATLTDPVTAVPRTRRVDTADLHADVTISYDWNERSAVNTMMRHWRLDGGTPQTDRIERRVWSRDQLDELALVVGFTYASQSDTGARCYVADSSS
jgi:SAM-dependent methyltransferase